MKTLIGNSNVLVETHLSISFLLEKVHTYLLLKNGVEKTWLKNVVKTNNWTDVEAALLCEITVSNGFGFMLVEVL